MPARRRSPNNPSADDNPKLLVSVQEAREALEATIAGAIPLLDISISSQAEFDGAKSKYYTWNEYNLALLGQLFSTDKLVRAHRGVLLGGGGSRPLSAKVTSLTKDIESDVRKLESVVNRLKLYEDPAIEAAADRGPAGEGAGVSEPGARAIGSQVFIVHGHDEAAREAVARFLGTFDLDPIILNEEPNRGGTLIEKLDRYRGIGYAIVLLTPDDIGGVKGSEYQDLRPRPRQNVILELGYFIAALGRNRVATLHKPEIEMPSDYAGSAYIPMDSAGAWKIALARELQDAGYAIDMNNIR